MNVKERKKLIRYIVPAVVFIGIIVFISIKYTPFIIKTVSNTEKFRDYILSYGIIGIFVFMGFQIMHIAIPVIPGELVQMAGGYVYGVIFGSALLIAGTTIGTTIIFYTSRMIGYPLVNIFVSKEKLEKFSFLTSSSKVEIAMFILFMIPGIPKDTLVYIAGVTPIKPSRFILISLAARTPGIIGSAFIGASLLEKDYKSVIIIAIFLLTVFTVGIICRKRLLSSLKSKRACE